VRSEEQIHSLLQPLDTKDLVREEVAHFKKEAEVVRMGWRRLSYRVGLNGLRRSLLLHIARRVRCLVVSVPEPLCCHCRTIIFLKYSL
jgi:hypothetical protein